MSEASRKHYFSVIRKVYDRLPPEIKRDFASPDDLRKWALAKGSTTSQRDLNHVDFEQTKNRVLEILGTLIDEDMNDLRRR